MQNMTVRQITLVFVVVYLSILRECIGRGEGTCATKFDSCLTCKIYNFYVFFMSDRESVFCCCNVIGHSSNVIESCRTNK